MISFIKDLLAFIYKAFLRAIKSQWFWVFVIYSNITGIHWVYNFGVDWSTELSILAVSIVAVIAAIVHHYRHGKHKK
jgi:hypothetical protein